MCHFGTSRKVYNLTVRTAKLTFARGNPFRFRNAYTEEVQVLAVYY